MITIYNYTTQRNKVFIKGKNAISLKKELFEKRGNQCYLCNRGFELNRLELEHKVPVILGGHLFDNNNIALVCIKCHNEKTLQDKLIIKRLRDLHIIWGEYQMFSIYPISQLKEIYLLLKEGGRLYKIWANGIYGIDYQQILQHSNRNELEEEKNE